MHPEKLDTPAAWQDLCDVLAEIGDLIVGPDGAETELDAAEGFRFGLRIIDLARTMTMENVDLDRPEFVRLGTPTRKGFIDNPDVFYDYAPVSPDRTYHVYGNRGGAHYLGFTIYAGSRDFGGAVRIHTNLNDETLTRDPDGSFHIVLGSDPDHPLVGRYPDNWIELEPDAAFVCFRQYFLDKDSEAPASYAIELANDAPAPPPLSDDEAARRLRTLATWLQRMTSTTINVGQLVARAPNRFFLAPGAGSDSGTVDATRLLSTPDNDYGFAFWRLGPDEALEIDFEPAGAHYWSFTVCNRWMESLDAIHRPVHVNSSQVGVEAGGRVHLVLAREDPGRGTWLDTAGHTNGFLCLRWLLAENPEAPDCRVVPLPS